MARKSRYLQLAACREKLREMRAKKRMEVGVDNQPADTSSGITLPVEWDHFTPDQYEENHPDGKRKLKRSAIPTVFTHQRPVHLTYQSLLPIRTKCSSRSPSGQSNTSRQSRLILPKQNSQSDDNPKEMYLTTSVGCHPIVFQEVSTVEQQNVVTTAGYSQFIVPETIEMNPEGMTSLGDNHHVMSEENETKEEIITASSDHDQMIVSEITTDSSQNGRLIPERNHSSILPGSTNGEQQVVTDVEDQSLVVLPNSIKIEPQEENALMDHHSVILPESIKTEPQEMDALIDHRSMILPKSIEMEPQEVNALRENCSLVLHESVKTEPQEMDALMDYRSMILPKSIEMEPQEVHALRENPSVVLPEYIKTEPQEMDALTDHHSTILPKSMEMELQEMNAFRENPSVVLPESIETEPQEMDVLSEQQAIFPEEMETEQPEILTALRSFDQAKAAKMTKTKPQNGMLTVVMERPPVILPKTTNRKQQTVTALPSHHHSVVFPDSLKLKQQEVNALRNNFPLILPQGANMVQPNITALTNHRVTILPQSQNPGKSFQMMMVVGSNNINNNHRTGLSVSERESKTCDMGTMCALPTAKEAEFLAIIQNLRRKLDLAQKEKRKAIKTANILSKTITSLFSDDQINFLKRDKKRTMRGSSWEESTVQKALKLRLACGATGYEMLRKMGYPFPAERTLQNRMEDVKFLPGMGLLKEIMPSLRSKAKLMENQEREAVLLIDELKTTPGFEYDPHMGQIIGKPTLSSSDGHLADAATHALVFMIAGLATRWSQVVAYHFTSGSFFPWEMKEFTFRLIKAVEEADIRINVIALDLGSQNQAFLNECGVKTGKNVATVNSCSHPCTDTRRLYFMYDASRILENIRNILANDQIITLSEELVTKYNLPTNLVSIKPIKQLLKLNCPMTLKLAPQLCQAVITPSSHNHIKIGWAVALMDDSVAAAIKHCVESGSLEQGALSTVWFIKMISTWFKTISSKAVGKSDSEEQEYEKAAQQLKEAIFLFRNLQIGSEEDWKPVQAGLILSTKSVLDLQELFLSVKGFKHLSLSHFSQDALENLFSMVQCRNPVPTCRGVKCALRLSCVSQLFQTNSHVSHKVRNSNTLDNFAKSIQSSQLFQNKPTAKQTEFQFDDDNLPSVSAEEMDEGDQTDNFSLTVNQTRTLPQLCRRVVRLVKQRYTLCNSCCAELETMEKVKHHANDSKLNKPEQHVNSSAVQEPLVCASNKVMLMLQNAETIFVNHEPQLLRGTLNLDELMMVSDALPEKHGFPKCHNVGSKLLREYYTSCFYLLVRKANSSIKVRSSSAGVNKNIGTEATISKLK